jgi:2-iminoacetate synthase ThiH
MGGILSTLVDRAIESAGLSDLLPGRRHARVTDGLALRLAGADLLALGALADRIRHDEVGDEVRIYTEEVAIEAGAGLILIGAGEGEATGLDLLRRVAISRVVEPSGANVRLDWVTCGLELAQVALGFGANELCGRIANKRGLPLAPGELAGVGKKSKRELADVVKRKELGGYVQRAGRIPVFVDRRGAREGTGEHDLAQESA